MFIVAGHRSSRITLESSLDRPTRRAGRPGLGGWRWCQGGDRGNSRAGGTMTQHRIALIGLGMAVTPHAKSLVDLRARVEVAGAFSRSAARRHAFAERFDFPLSSDLDAIVADPSVDAVMILTPPNTHLGAARALRRRQQARPAGEAARALDRGARPAGRGGGGRRHQARRGLPAPLSRSLRASARAARRGRSGRSRPST